MVRLSIMYLGDVVQVSWKYPAGHYGSQHADHLQSVLDWMKNNSLATDHFAKEGRVELTVVLNREYGSVSVMSEVRETHRIFGSQGAWKVEEYAFEFDGDSCVTDLSCSLNFPTRGKATEFELWWTDVV
ncbi:MAG: hypothetical protein FP819_03645 [Rhizobiaceae bacterium]|nr:hypothetical protein [Rhizobiaceae bacterium]